MLIRHFIARTSDEPHRVATSLELFFDLVCVVAIAAATQAYHHAVSDGHAAQSFIVFLFVILGVWWSWANFTWFSTSFDNDDSLYRLLVFVIIGGYALFAGGTAHIFETLDTRLGIIGWVVMRIALVLLWLRAAIANPAYRRAATIYIVGLTAAQILWVTHYLLLGGHADEAGLFFVAALPIYAIEVGTPLLAGRRNHPPMHRHHMVERHGLLNIIILGEIVFSATLYSGALHDGQTDPGILVGGIATLVIVFAMFALYFLEEDHMRAVTTGRRFVRWGYLHAIIYVGGAMVGAAAAAQLDWLTGHSHATGEELALVTNGALAIYLAGLWIVRDKYKTGLARAALPAGVLACALAGVLAAPYWVTATIAVATLFLRLSPAALAGDTAEAEGDDTMKEA
ncbi:low temperature requirement protein A [Limimaricola sp.]|uniref:low temperature requirement protein A n=1 Tax=Limimaricola sp. TaxID=2211665 RepID=UPI0025BCAF9E|nr:low temperature requirement protein A [Limimaricola sp.]